MITSKTISDHYERHTSALLLLQETAERAIHTKIRWETVAAQGLVLKDEDGKPLIKGKNIAERDANAKELYAVQWQAHLIAEEDLRLVRYKLDLSRLEETEIKLLMRLMEVLKGETDQG